MAITIDALPDVTRSTPFSLTVNVVADGIPLEVIESVVVTPINIDSGVAVNNTTISGSYNDIFKDSITFIDKGKSDKTDLPITVIGTGNVPENKELFSLVDDTRQSVMMNYNVVVTYSQGVLTETIQHKVINTIGSSMTFLQGYFNV